MGTIAVIPARYSSKRLPGKPLADLLGKPMIQWVYERVLEARRVDEVIIATDDDRIHAAAEGFGARSLMTSPDHASGTDRVAEVAAALGLGGDTDLVVNVQGDEPLLAPEAIDDAVALAQTTPGAMATLKKEIRSHERLFDENVVKVTTDAEGFALYFSRSPIPSAPHRASSDSAELPPDVYYEHIGLYVYPAGTLTRLAATPPVMLERVERLEQLRALVHGVRIRVAETRHDSIAVDTASDLDEARARLREASASSTTMKNENKNENENKNDNVNEAMVRSVS